jgi:hypothetical protein
MGIFGGGNSQKPTRLNGIQITQSVQGLPLPWVLGRGRVQQSLLYEDSFSAKKITQGGKGGGKGGAQSYIYSADVIAGLCEGTIKGINDVWAGQNWLSNNSSVENYVIAGSGIYTPLNSSAFVLDAGVGMLNNYSGSLSDAGAPAPTVLNASSYAPMVQVDYGTTLTTGTYSVNPADGSYHFDVAHDAGKSVQLSYSFRLQFIRQQMNATIPSGKTVTVGGTLPFNKDLGVRYITGSGAALTKDGGSGFPGSAGHYTQSGSAPATYKFAAADIAAEVQITYQLEDDAVVGQDQPTTLNFTLFNGAQSQSIWSFMSSKHPEQALGYTRTAYVGYNPMDLGAGGQIQDVLYEVTTTDSYGSGVVDCNPVQCITQVLTNTVCGLGSGITPFPTSVIDNGPLGTWGGPAGSPGAHTVSNTAWSWFAANGFFISPVIDSQVSAASLIAEWIEAGMCAAFMSEGLFKLVPYGDTSMVANGQTWVAPANFVVALDDSCFLGNPGEDPVQISRAAWQDGYNECQVNFNNRGNQYSPELIQEFDQAAIDRYGLRLEDPKSWGFITELPAAVFAANMRVKRGVNIRNTYVFTLPFNYSYLEPMDLVTITTSSIWAQGLNNVNLGINTLPVRIQKIVDDPVNGLEITAEDYPWGIHQPVVYNKDVSTGNVVANAYAIPGTSEVVLFEASSRLTGYSGNEIWIGASGQSDNWGSCNVWVSQDGTKYLEAGSIKTPARLGALDATFASGSDPDTTHSLVVDMAVNSVALDAGTTTDADLGTTMCFVDGEIISYSAVTVTGQDQYTMGTYIRRGQMGTTIASHPAGSLFMRLDDSVFRFQYDPTWVGKTIYFKFQSVNSFGNNAESLDSLTPTTFVIPGAGPGTVDASSGLILGVTGQFNVGAGPLGWPSAAQT